MPTQDLAALVKSCRRWNRGEFHEILWEYNYLTPSILRERNARGWFYYEGDRLEGFALGRHLQGWWHFEELWGPCEGSSELPASTNPKDAERANRFQKLLHQLNTRTLIRAAIDNPFANLISRNIGARWSGGYLLSTRSLGRKLAVRVPKGFQIRRFRKGD